MPRRLCALVIVIVLGAATGASATPSAPVVSKMLVVASRDDPHAGRPFIGYLFVVPTAARRGLVSVDASCPATVLGRTVPARVSRVPEGASIPSVLLCTWSIPRDRVGWTFRGTMDVELQRRLANGSIEINTDEGRITRWIVQP
jgi:hypothetical protein